MTDQQIVTTEARDTPDERYMTLVETLIGSEEVSFDPTAKKGFGSLALKTGGKIFAMLVNERLVVKLPRHRVDGLVASGAGERFDPGHGRLMKEWLTIAPAHEDEWQALASEALAFVASQG